MALIGGCVSAGHLPQAQAAAPTFDPIAFFAGKTTGQGTLRIVLRSSRPTFVTGSGEVGSDGAITLDQTVRRGNSAPTRRTWHLRSVAPQRYAGTLTDATGPVAGEVSGNLFHIAFTMKGGPNAQQWLYLQPDGRSARNVMAVRKLDVLVARLDEVISRD